MSSNCSLPPKAAAAVLLSLPKPSPASEKQDVEADTFKRWSVLDGLGLIPPSNSAYSLFPALTFFTALNIAIPWEGFSVFPFSQSLL